MSRIFIFYKRVDKEKVFKIKDKNVNEMNRLLSILAIFFAFIRADAQSVSFSFDSCKVKQVPFEVSSAEKNISLLLTEINMAKQANRSLNLNHVNMEEEAKNKLRRYWSIMHFACEQPIIKQQCIQDLDGYQIRDIPITLCPFESTFQGSTEKAIVVCLNNKGQISGVHTALNNDDYECFMGIGDTITDKRQRLEIVKIVEIIMSCYSQKDLNTLREIFCNDPIIITGSSTIRNGGNNMNGIVNRNIRYNSIGHNESLNKINYMINRSSYVDVDVNGIKIEKNKAKGKEHFYGVTFKQKLKSDKFSDEGSVFLLLEIPEDGDPPIIHVKSLQQLNDGKNTDKNEPLEMDGFITP